MHASTFSASNELLKKYTISLCRWPCMDRAVLVLNPRVSEKCDVIRPTQEAAYMGRRGEFSHKEKIAAVKLQTKSGRNLLSNADGYGIHGNTMGKWKLGPGIIGGEADKHDKGSMLCTLLIITGNYR